MRQTSANTSQPISPQIVTRAENFLRNQYNSTVGLDSEFPGAKTYWLYSDNFLASYVLRNINPSNSTLVQVGDNISQTLSHYTAGIPDALNEYMILNTSIFAFDASTNYNVGSVGASTVSITLNNGSTALNPNNYGDITFLESLYYDKINQECQALSLYQTGANMYDGVGISDKAFSGVYQTYKLALYVYASEILGENYSSTALSTLLNRQATNGGFYTGYDSSYSNAGTFTNVETTALAILAISTPMNSQPQKPQCLGATPLLCIGIVVVGVLAVVGVSLMMIRRRARNPINSPTLNDATEKLGKSLSRFEHPNEPNSFGT